MKIICYHCKEESEKTTGYYNRAKNVGAKLFCSKKCFCNSIKTSKKDKIEAKRLYDKKYKENNLAKIKSKKKAYYEANKKNIYAKQRVKNDNDEYRKKHAEYCSRPDQRFKEKQNRYKRILGADFSEQTKFCIVCEEDKFIMEFEHSPIYPDNRKYICKNCDAQHMNEYGYSTTGTLSAMVARRYTNLTREDIVKYPYLIEANKFLILLKQLVK